jgi:predicted RNase H-like nuclease
MARSVQRVGDLPGSVTVIRLQGTSSKILARGSIGIDVIEYRRSGDKQFDDLLDGILCAYLAYYYWYWGEEGSWVVGDLNTGYVTLPRRGLENCAIGA